MSTPLPIVVIDRSHGESGEASATGCRRRQDREVGEDFAEPVDGLRPPSRFGLGNQGLDQLPLGIGQIGGGFSPVIPFLRPNEG